MLHIMRTDPEASVRLVRESFQTKAVDTNSGFDASEVHLALLEVVTDVELHNVDMLSKLLHAGMLSFLRDYIARSTFLVMPEEEDTQVGSWCSSSHNVSSRISGNRDVAPFQRNPGRNGRSQ